jgi:hypothetical protein
MGTINWTGTEDFYNDKYNNEIAPHVTGLNWVSA